MKKKKNKKNEKKKNDLYNTLSTIRRGRPKEEGEKQMIKKLAYTVRTIKIGRLQKKQMKKK